MTLRVLLLGQTPPPYHGQSIMIQALVDHPYTDLVIEHLKMNYSRSIQEIGRFNLTKIVELFRITGAACWRLIVQEVDVIYYPPAGSGRNAVLRDIFTLTILRSFKAKAIVFHFHAMGLDREYGRMGWFAQWLFRRAYFQPDLALCLASENIGRVKFLEPKKVSVIPYGVPDCFPQYRQVAAQRSLPDRTPRVLFVGNLILTKGVMILLDAAQLLFDKRLEFEVVFVGGNSSAETDRKIKDHPASHDHRTSFLGTLIGEKKWEQFAKADIFCFPTYYESENLSVVVIEAMQFELPVVSTVWGAIPSLVEDGKTGYLVPPEDVNATALRLEQLILDSDLRSKLGSRGRERYAATYSLDHYTSKFESSVKNLNPHIQ